MIRCSLFAGILLFALGLVANAQTGASRPETKDRKKPAVPASRGLAERLAGAWGETVEPQEESLLSAAKVAARKLGSVDRRRLDALEQRLTDIRSQERQLKRQLERLDQGFPVALDVWEEPGLEGIPLDRGRLDEERKAVLALQAKLERIRRAREAKRLEAERDRRARRDTVRSTSLLDVDLSVPPPPAAAPDRRPVGGRHAVRLADALYRADDHRGATRQYEAALASNDPKMTPEKLYRLARSHEKLGDFAAARRALDALFKKASDPKSFWNRRAVQLRDLLDKSESLQKLLRREQP